jgi:hypothetical protein
MVFSITVKESTGNPNFLWDTGGGVLVTFDSESVWLPGAGALVSLQDVNTTTKVAAKKRQVQKREGLCIIG